MDKTLLVLFSIILALISVHGVNINFQKILNRSHLVPESKHLPENVVEAFITQRLDNFDPTNNVTWQQRYLINNEFWEPGGCIFVLLAGEWEVTPDRFVNTMMYQMSREFRCYMVHLENRYYGQSHPTEDVSNENLRYLTVEQILADTAHFIEYVRLERVTAGAENAPLIVIGRRFAGSLSIWFRQSYPHLAVGAWSSSSPTSSVVDHFQYKELIGAVYRHIGGNECYDRLERGFAAMQQMIANGQNEEIADLFNLCNEIENTSDEQTFFLSISDFYSSLTQFEQSFLFDVTEVCDRMSNESLSDVEALARIFVDSLDGRCIDLGYDKLIADYRQTNWNDPAVVDGLRQWAYQRCYQLGWYHSSNSRFQPFGSQFPVEFIFQACEDVFGELYSPDLMLENSARFNTAFGGVTPRATNVLYVHGQLDPWRSVGVQIEDNESATVIVIEGASQSSDIGPVSETDSDAVLVAKETIKDTILSWIRASQNVNGTP